MKRILRCACASPLSFPFCSRQCSFVQKRIRIFPMSFRLFSILTAVILASAHIDLTDAQAANPKLLIIKDDLGTTSEEVIRTVAGFGYSFTEVLPELITPELVSSHELSVLLTGNNPNPCQNNFMRNLLISHANAGGKILVEGGDNGYAGAVFPGYAAFTNKVLKISAWITDADPVMLLNQDYAGSDLANIPNVLPETIPVVTQGGYYQDVCRKMETSYLLYKASVEDDAGGVVFFPNIDDPQIINICFSFNAIDRSLAKNLLANILRAMIGSPVGVHQTSAEIPQTSEILRCYPNPFNPSARLEFSVSRRSMVSIRIYNTLGMLKKEIFSDQLDAGSYKMTIDLSGNPSGIYFAELTAGDARDVHLISFMK